MLYKYTREMKTKKETFPTAAKNQLIIKRHTDQNTLRCKTMLYMLDVFNYDFLIYCKLKNTAFP